MADFTKIDIFYLDSDMLVYYHDFCLRHMLFMVGLSKPMAP